LRKKELSLDDIHKIRDENLLIDIVAKCYEKNPKIRDLAIHEIKNVDNKNVDKITKENGKVLHALAKKLRSSEIVEIWYWYHSKKNENKGSREKAINKISNQNILADIAKENNEYEDARQSSFDKIDDKSILETIAESSDYTKKIREKAIYKINDDNILFNIALKNNNVNLREVAIKIILNKKESEKESIRQRYMKDAKIAKKNFEQSLTKRFDEGKIDLIEKIVDSYESIEKGIHLKESSKDSLENLLKSIYSKSKDILEKEGLEKIPTKKRKYDSSKHDVVSTEEDPNYEDDDIIEELRKGYTFNDKVIKYSQVKICKNSE